MVVESDAVLAAPPHCFNKQTSHAPLIHSLLSLVHIFIIMFAQFASIRTLHVYNQTLSLYRQNVSGCLCFSILFRFLILIIFFKKNWQNTHCLC